MSSLEVLDLDIDWLNGLSDGLLDLDDRQLKVLCNDFSNGLVKGVLVKSTTSVLGVLFYYYSYSTWEARCLYISKIWLLCVDATQNEDVFNCLIGRLIDTAKQLSANRINFNLNVSDDRQGLGEMFARIGGVDLSNEEKWVLYRMDLEKMKEFVQHRDDDGLRFNNSDYVIEEACVERDGNGVCGLIRELAEFEQMADQFKLTSNDLVNDTAFYKCLVARNTNTNHLISCIMYYFSYNISLGGLGCYLEDLYVTREHRNCKVGTSMWQYMVQDCLKKQVKFMEWSCLDWNVNAMKFYAKHQAYQLDNLHIFRIKREVIHKKK